MEEPSVAWIETHDGERVECLLERIAPDVWQATPVRNVALEDVAGTYIDVLPPRTKIEYHLIEVQE